MKPRLCTEALVAAVAIATISATARALDINLIDVGASPMTAEQFSAFEAGARIWENALSDPITLTINVAWDEPDTFSRSTVLASTSSARTTANYSSVLRALQDGAVWSSERTAMSSLPASSVPLLDINGTRTDNRITMATANAKALGLGTGLDPDYGEALANNADAQIRYNTGYLTRFDFDRSDGISASGIDFIGVASHEIGHALGFLTLTDVQDRNDDFVLHPNVLDLWRFDETGAPHGVGTENRQLTAGAAEYYDTQRNNVSLSHGITEYDPLCDATDNLCQASHWSDSLGNLMDPTFSRGVRADPLSADRHALNYVGYELTPLRFYLPPRRWYVGFFEPRFLDDPPKFGGLFDQDAELPDAQEEGIKPTADTNLAIRLGFDFEIEGMKLRSGLGLANFVPAVENPNTKVVIADFAQSEDTDFLEPRPPMTVIPPRITHFSFVSDDEAGKQFHFVDGLAESGAMFDATIGEFGGFRIAGFIDGEGDGKQDDTDAMMALLLELTEKNGFPGPNNPQAFFKVNVEQVDNGINIFDPLALGLESPPLLGDYNGNDQVEQADLDLVLLNWGKQTPPIPPNWVNDLPSGRIDQAELDRVLLGWGQTALTSPAEGVPEPFARTLAGLGIAVAIMLRKRK
jgi:hypothetical protein